MNKLQKYSVAVAISMLPLSLEAATYRWTDSKGVMHYSNAIPASDAQLGHTELSKSGLKKKEVISAKKNRELKELVEVQKEQKKLAAKKKKEKARQEEEEIRLLSIFSSEDEVVNTYNAKLRMAQLTIDLLKSRHKKQSERLAVLERKEESSTNIDHKHTLTKQIDLALDNLSIYQQAITENLVEKDRVRKEYKRTLSRFKKLLAKTQATK